MPFRTLLRFPRDFCAYFNPLAIAEPVEDPSDVVGKDMPSRRCRVKDRDDLQKLLGFSRDE